MRENFVNCPIIGFVKYWPLFIPTRIIGQFEKFFLVDSNQSPRKSSCPASHAHYWERMALLNGVRARCTAGEEGYCKYGVLGSPFVVLGFSWVFLWRGSLGESWGEMVSRATCYLHVLTWYFKKGLVLWHYVCPSGCSWDKGSFHWWEDSTILDGGSIKGYLLGKNKKWVC